MGMNNNKGMSWDPKSRRVQICGELHKVCPREESKCLNAGTYTSEHLDGKECGCLCKSGYLGEFCEQSLGYGEEYTRTRCKVTTELKDICDGSTEDCLLKGMLKCNLYYNCYGIMVNNVDKTDTSVKLCRLQDLD